MSSTLERLKREAGIVSGQSGSILPHVEEPGLVIPDFPQCTPAKLRIIHVGMGAGGLLTAHKARKHLQNYELICYEKNDQIGGTWYENRYPGCACDIPSHTYTFTFDPNPEWSGYYSYAPEIQDYFENFYRKHKLEEYVVFQTEVISATWHADKGLWHVHLRCSDGSTFTDTCHVLINGSGLLNRWKWPDIEGLDCFGGVLAHSAKWPRELDWKGKRVAVIGNGSSSIQIVPEVAETASHLTVFMRNPTYIGPPFGSSVSNKEADSDAMEPQGTGKHTYTEKEKKRFREDPEYHLKYRQAVEKAVVGGWDMFYRGSKLNNYATKMMRKSMAEKLGNRDDIKEKLIPSWSPGCRRLTPGEGYLEALIRENVSIVHDEIVRITPMGLVTRDGKEHEVDIIVCATGFHVQYFPHFKVTGMDGQVMQDQSTPNLYASVAAPGFPNYFVVNGPRGNWAQGCVLASHEAQIEYILQCCRKMQEDHIKSLEPKADITKQFNLYTDAWHAKHSVWAEDCRSWFKENTVNGRIHVWPGSLLHHLKFMKHPRYEHYNVTYKDQGNIFQFLGDGRTIGQTKYGADAPVPYIRNDEDEPWDLE